MPRALAMFPLTALALAATSGCGWRVASFTAGRATEWDTPAPVGDPGDCTELGLSVWRDDAPLSVGVSVFTGGDGSNIVAAYGRAGVGQPLYEEGRVTAGVGVMATLGLWSWQDSPEDTGVLGSVSAVLAITREGTAGRMLRAHENPHGTSAVMLEYGALWLSDVVGESGAEVRGWRLSYAHEF